MVQDELLIEQLNQKQVGAFKILFDRFYRYLVLYAMKWVERQEIAEDVVQDLFVQVWETQGSGGKVCALHASDIRGGRNA